MIHLEDYQKYRWFFTSNSILVVGGKSANQNDELIKKIKEKRKDFIVMHTADPGSPFAIILADKKDLSPEDLEQTAIWTASFSRKWREQNKTATVDIFNLSQLKKSLLMKTGTWGVKGQIQKKSVSLSLVLTKQNDKLRAVPKKTAEEILLYISPGKKDKTLQVEKIQKIVKASKEEILGALPPGGVNFRK